MSEPDRPASESTRPGTSVQRTSRDPEQLRLALQAWIAGKLPAGADPQIAGLSSSAATGMSSETVLFPVEWSDATGEKHTENLVCRIAPHPDDVPVFPVYDMGSQFRVVQRVGELTGVPVPHVRWLELDTSILGTPFFVMDRVHGIAPPDNPPYTFGGNWLFDATPEQRRTLQESLLDVLATLHAIPDAEREFGFLFTAEETAAGPTPLHRKVARTRRWYDWTVEASGTPSPLVDRAFRWLEEHWPSDVSETVLSWGDSRVGNVLFEDFEPTAVLDWEMAAVCPREVDLGWSIYAHQIFQDMATGYGFPGLPDVLDKDTVAAYYAERTGYQPRELEWYITYSAIQYAIVFLRTGARSVRFGEREAPEHVDDLIINKDPLERMLAGTYWS